MLFAVLTVMPWVGATVARAEINLYFRNGAPVETRITTDLSALQPDMQRVPGTRVYYTTTDAYDVYRYGRSYYVFDNGYWYRASNLNSPFVFVQPQYVPRPVAYVPKPYRKHWTVVERTSRWESKGRGHSKKHH